MGLNVELLTGDSTARGHTFSARTLGIDTVNVGQTPQQKMAHVQRFNTPARSW